MDTPRWLEDEREILELLHAFLDKLDRKPAGEWKHPPAVTVSQTHFPRLFQFGQDADSAWGLLRVLEQDFRVLTIKLDRKRGPYEPEYARARLVLNPAMEDTLRNWLARPRETPLLRQWREAVERAQHHFPGDSTRLKARPILVPGKSAEDIVKGFISIAGIGRNELNLRQISALSFWGHSKVLDNREDLLTALYPNLVIKPRKILVNVYLPETVTGVLFIENQDSYTSAIEGVPAAAANMALVYCSGFRGSAQRIRDRAGVSLHFQGEGYGHWRERWEQWWLSNDASPWPTYFWGDLDYSGMAILKVLRQRFPEMHAWPPGYHDMLHHLLEGRGHSPWMGDKEEQIDPGMTGCPLADNVLLPAIREQKLFVDQEIIIE
ncbi:MAG: hypothetical protein HYX62_09365 [Gammaproteobacteria bacterium]|jgi:hypothetical protein|nr:hypothetical protein [Gammaproteobacteria bacterium]